MPAWRMNPLANTLVSIGEGKHPFPFRTRRLSPQSPMVVGPCCPVRVGYRQVYDPGLRKRSPGSFFGKSSGFL